MLIATFGPTTAWVGKRISHEGGSFLLDGYGPITAGDIMDYDRQGHLIWANEGSRAWVGSRAANSRTTRGAGRDLRTAAAGAKEWYATSRFGDSLSESRTAYWKRALLLAIVVLTVLNVVLMLVAFGVFRGP